jgi:hypothetical protein
MHHLGRAVLSMLAALSIVAVAGCGAGRGVTSAVPSSLAPAHSAVDSVPSAEPTVAIPVCGPFPVPPVDPANFPAPTKIDNRWFPLVPGTQFVVKGYANRNGAPLGHQIVSTVTDLTKVINGVSTVVVWEVDRKQSELASSRLAFFAQDRDGNVWSFGQYPELYVNGKLAGAPKTWLAGLAGASAGLLVRDEPSPGSAEFLQAAAPKADLLDCARDVQIDARTCVTNNCYDGVAVVDERSGEQPAAGASPIHRKFYAPGVGGVRVEALGNPAGETLVLANAVILNPEALAAARKNALELERRAYQSNANGVYRQTSPAASRP